MESNCVSKSSFMVVLRNGRDGPFTLRRRCAMVLRVTTQIWAVRDFLLVRPDKLQGVTYKRITHFFSVSAYQQQQELFLFLLLIL